MVLSNKTNSPFLIPQEACDYLRITRPSLYNLVWLEKLKPIRKGTGKRARLLFLKSELDRYLGISDGH